MRLFSPLYDRALRWAGHRHAPWYLGGLSFAESSFFPIPPDVMLIPMTLAHPDRGLRYALLTTVTSVVGGFAGYLIGMFAIELAEPWILSAGYWEAYLAVQEWFRQWGFLAVLLAGFSPVPYKLFTITAGAMAMLLPGFLLASLIGRGSRFFLVAGLIQWGGQPFADRLRRHIDLMGWTVVALVVLAYLVHRWLAA